MQAREVFLLKNRIARNSQILLMVFLAENLSVPPMFVAVPSGIVRNQLGPEWNHLNHSFPQLQNTEDELQRLGSHFLHQHRISRNPDVNRSRLITVPSLIVGNHLKSD